MRSLEDTLEATKPYLSRNFWIRYVGNSYNEEYLSERFPKEPTSPSLLFGMRRETDKFTMYYAEKPEMFEGHETHILWDVTPKPSPMTHLFPELPPIKKVLWSGMFDEGRMLFHVTEDQRIYEVTGNSITYLVGKSWIVNLDTEHSKVKALCFRGDLLWDDSVENDPCKFLASSWDRIKATGYGNSYDPWVMYENLREQGDERSCTSLLRDFFPMMGVL